MHGVHTGHPYHITPRSGTAGQPQRCPAGRRLRGESAVRRQALAGLAGKGFPRGTSTREMPRSVPMVSLRHRNTRRARARPPAAASPGPSGSSPGPACQSRWGLWLRRLQVDSLMLQEWFILQPLSWTGAGPDSQAGPGIPRRGGEMCSMAAKPPASRVCLLSLEKTFNPPQKTEQALLLKRETKAQPPFCQPLTPNPRATAGRAPRSLACCSPSVPPTSASRAAAGPPAPPEICRAGSCHPPHPHPQG